MTTQTIHDAPRVARGMFADAEPAHLRSLLARYEDQQDAAVSSLPTWYREQVIAELRGLLADEPPCPPEPPR